MAPKRPQPPRNKSLSNGVTPKRRLTADTSSNYTVQCAQIPRRYALSVQGARAVKIRYFGHAEVLAAKKAISVTSITAKTRPSMTEEGSQAIKQVRKMERKWQRTECDLDHDRLKTASPIAS